MWSSKPSEHSITLAFVQATFLPNFIHSQDLAIASVLWIHPSMSKVCYSNPSNHCEIGSAAIARVCCIGSFLLTSTGARSRSPAHTLIPCHRFMIWASHLLIRWVPNQFKILIFLVPKFLTVAAFGCISTLFGSVWQIEDGCLAFSVVASMNYLPSTPCVSCCCCSSCMILA